METCMFCASCLKAQKHAHFLHLVPPFTSHYIINNGKGSVARQFKNGHAAEAFRSCEEGAADSLHCGTS